MRIFFWLVTLWLTFLTSVTFADTLDPSSVTSVDAAYDTIMGNGSTFDATATIIKTITFAIVMLFSGWAVYGLYEAYVDGQIKVKGLLWLLLRLLLMITILAVLLTV